MPKHSCLSQLCKRGKRNHDCQRSVSRGKLPAHIADYRTSLAFLTLTIFMRLSCYIALVLRHSFGLHASPLLYSALQFGETGTDDG